jgi:hypothetical protein
MAWKRSGVRFPSAPRRIPGRLHFSVRWVAMINESGRDLGRDDCDQIGIVRIGAARAPNGGPNRDSWVIEPRVEGQGECHVGPGFGVARKMLPADEPAGRGRHLRTPWQRPPTSTTAAPSARASSPSTAATSDRRSHLSTVASGGIGVVDLGPLVVAADEVGENASAWETGVHRSDHAHALSGDLEGGVHPRAVGAGVAWRPALAAISRRRCRPREASR